MDHAPDGARNDLSGVWVNGYSIAELWGYTKPVSRPEPASGQTHVLLWGILSIVDYQVDQGDFRVAPSGDSRRPIRPTHSIGICLQTFRTQAYYHSLTFPQFPTRHLAGFLPFCRSHSDNKLILTQEVFL